MVQLNDITYDSGSETVRAGFGNTWGDVYGYVEAFDRLVVGARAPTVGLATLLGGKILFSLFSSICADCDIEVVFLIFPTNTDSPPTMPSLSSLLRPTAP